MRGVKDDYCVPFFHGPGGRSRLELKTDTFLVRKMASNPPGQLAPRLLRPGLPWPGGRVAVVNILTLTRPPTIRSRVCRGSSMPVRSRSTETEN